MFFKKRPRERGAAAVEAALVTPLLVLMVLGIVELALLMRDDVALSSAVRVGGRIASTNAAAGPSGVGEGGDCVSGCDPKNTPLFARYAADAIAQAGTALPKDAINELWVYKANKQGYPGADGNTTWSCSSNCVIYKWVPKPSNSALPGQFRYYSGTWTSSTVNACANNNPDDVGIYMTATHKTITGFVIHDVGIEDHAVFQFEPLPSATCAPGTHS